MSKKDVTIITPKGLSAGAYLKDLLDYHQLLWAFTYRHLRAKYAQTMVGLTWAFISPLFTLLILGFVFGKVAKMDTQGLDPFLFTIVGLSAWTYFSTVVTWAGQSIVNAQGMIKKIYFPRLLLPLSIAIAGLLDFLVVLILVGILFLINHQVPSVNMMYFPLYMALVILAGVTGGIWISALGIRYRDFHHLIPFLLRIGLYASPVAYATTAIESKYQLLYQLNPLTGILEGFRWCFFGGVFPEQATLISVLAVLLLFISSIFYFTTAEKNMADII